ncbi:ABC transporter permease [Vibrio sp. 1CM23M]|uniref:ABC transporter permease n=1 Tax=Vibrio sp. 1CM23M TaxID=2929164 RepID=UPI0020C0C506|nr:ABC transporter permease [Vibrio sp. 1CM23M]
MKSQANRFMLSYLWWFLEPLLFVGMFFVIFGYVLDRGGDRYFEFLVVGKIVFMWFSKGVTMGSNSLVQNKGIIGQSSIPKWIFPIVNTLEATYRTLIAFLILAIIILFNFSGNFLMWLQLIPLSFMTLWFILSLSMVLSVLVSFAEDISQIISLLMMGMLFSSGIFWDVNQISNSEISYLIFALNPLALYIDSYREVLLHGEIVDYSRFGFAMLTNIIFTLVSIGLFYYGNNKITRRLFS